MGSLSFVHGRVAEIVRSAGRGEDLVSVRSKTGMPSLKAGGVSLHSLYDPEREAREWVDHHRSDIDRAAHLVVFGFGLGYHLAELVRATEKEITVFEPRPDVLRAAWKALDLSPVLSRVRIVTDAEVPALPRPVRVLRHLPSVGVSPAYFAAIASRIEALRASAKGLRIAVVGPFHGGSLPIAGYCSDALRNLGHEVEFIDNAAFADAFLSIDRLTEEPGHRAILREKIEGFASEAAMARMVPFRPDLVLALAQAPLQVPALAALREKGIASAFWFVEDFRHMEYWRCTAPHYDFFFTIQGGEFLDRLRESGARHAAFLPLAASPAIHRRAELSAAELAEFGSDVSFVGAGYHNRRKLFEGLTDFDFRIWGNEWNSCPPLQEVVQRDGARVGAQDIVKIFCASKINLNLHSSSYHEGVNPYGDFVNPRTFEIAACGGFQLVDARSDLAGFFEIGKEIVTFGSLEELRRKILYYLSRPEERAEIAERGRCRALRDHTYERRMQDVLECVFRTGYASPWEASRKTEDPESLAEEAGADTDLGAYLGRFADARSVKLADVVRGIQAGEGNLSRVERIFLAMNEIGR